MSYFVRYKVLVLMDLSTARCTDQIHSRLFHAGWCLVWYKTRIWISFTDIKFDSPKFGYKNHFTSKHHKALRFLRCVLSVFVSIIHEFNLLFTSILGFTYEQWCDVLKDIRYVCKRSTTWEGSTTSFLINSRRSY